MRIEKQELLGAAKKVGIAKPEAEALWTTLHEKEPTQSAKFEASHLLYYLGAMIVLVSMGLLMSLSWQTLGAGALLGIAILYFFIFFFLGKKLWHKKQLKTPGGLFLTLALCMVPLIIYSIQHLLGLWIPQENAQLQTLLSWMKGGRFAMEVATIVAGIALLKYYRFPFMTAPIFFALWFLTTDITSILVGDQAWLHPQSWVSLAFGLLLMVIAYIVDLRSQRDFAFWGYLFGLSTFWFSLALLYKEQMPPILFLVINLALIVIGLLLQRTLFLIFGSIGLFLYIVQVAAEHFANSVWFPIMMSGIGLLIIFLGITYHKKRPKIEDFFLKILPKGFSHFLPKK